MSVNYLVKELNMVKVTKILQSDMSVIYLAEDGEFKVLVCLRDFTLDNLADTAGLYLWFNEGADLKCEGALLQRLYEELVAGNGAQFKRFDQLVAYLVDGTAANTGWLANYFCEA